MMMMQAQSSAHIKRGWGGSCECAPRHPRTHTGRLAHSHSHSHSYSTLIPIDIPTTIPILIPTLIPTKIPTKIPILIPSDEKAIRHKGFTRGIGG